MVTERKSSLLILVLLAVMMVVYHVGIIMYFVVGAQPSPTFEFLYMFGFIWGVIWFLRAEAERSAAAQAYCSGVTIGMVWFVLLPYHLINSRGARGLIPLSALIGTWLALQVLVTVVNEVYTGAFG